MTRKALFQGATLGCIALIAFPVNSFALQGPSGISNTQTNVNCDDFCKQFGPAPNWDTSQGQPQAIGIRSSSNTWSTQDDVLCCQLSGGNSSYQTSSSCPSFSPDPTPSFTGTCANNITIPNSLYSIITNAPAPNPNSDTGSSGLASTTDPSQMCIQAGNILNRCQYHNSQVENYCLAYNILTGHHSKSNLKTGLDADITLAAIDFSVAASCAVGCFSMNPLLAIGACGVGAMIEGAYELTVTMAQQEEMAPVLDQYKGMGGADPGGLAVTGQAGTKAGNIMSDVGLGIGAGLTAANLMKVRQYGKEGAEVEKEVEKEGAKDGTDAGKESKTLENSRRAMACSAMVLYAGLGGIRTAAAIGMNGAKAKACQAVNASFSNSNGAAPPPSGNNSNASGNGSSTGGGSTSVGNGGSAGSSVSGGGSAGNTSASSDASMSAAIDSCRGNPSLPMPQCLAGQGITLPPPTASQATDANLLNNPNLGQALQNAPSIHDLANKALKEGAGAALAAALPPQLGAAGAGLAEVARVAQDNASKLANAMGLETAAVFSGGGSGGAHKEGASGLGTGPFFGAGFGGTFGAKGSDRSVANFDAKFQLNDIWHSNSHLTLFEIISDKLGRVSSRVH